MREHKECFSTAGLSGGCLEIIKRHKEGVKAFIIIFIFYRCIIIMVKQEGAYFFCRGEQFK